MHKYKFTVFTPTYNREHLLHRVFDSLQVQDFIDFEWLILDDGSSDNTKQVVDEFVNKSNFNIRYIFKKNGGKVAAVNMGLELAEGEFFLVFDSDDWCDSNTLSTFIDEWNKLNNDEKLNKMMKIMTKHVSVAGAEEAELG